MTYYPGTTGLGPLGIPDDGPRIVCDVDGCGRVYRLREGRMPPAWFLDGKPPPGWQRAKINIPRLDRCAQCKRAGRPLPPSRHPLNEEPSR